MFEFLKRSKDPKEQIEKNKSRIKVSDEVNAAIDLVRSNFKYADNQLAIYRKACIGAKKAFDYEPYMNKAWQSIYATSMSKARKADLGKLKPEKKALYLNEIEDKLLKREADKKINLHRPSFAAYTIANGICGVKPSPRVTSLFIEPLDDEIEDMFKKVQDEVTEMFGEDI